MMTHRRSFVRPGLFAPAILLALASVGTPAVVQAQAAPPPPSVMPVPGELELAKLIWTTMVAVDQANLSGNYSVLRDISAPAFQQVNDPARLTEIFAGVRASRIDLSNTLLLAPTYTATPQMLDATSFRVQGYFGLRPTAVGFNFTYQWVQGRWRLYGIGLNPLPLATIQPGGPAPAAAQPQPPAPARRN